MSGRVIGQLEVPLERNKFSIWTSGMLDSGMTDGDYFITTPVFSSNLELRGQ